MAEPVLMIALSPTMKDGLVSSWLVKEGQAVKAGDALCEVETDKATMAYESPKAGVILKILAASGSKASVGQAIAVMGKAGEDWASAVPAAPTAPAEPSPNAEPAAASATPLASAPAAVSSSAAAVSATQAPRTGAGASQPGAGASLGEPAAALPPPATTGRRPSAPASLPPSSPLARRLARERGIDIRSVAGSGPRGRVVARDLDGASASGAQAQPDAASSRVAASVTGASSSGGLRGDRVPLSPMRSTIASRLGTSWSQAPHFFVRAAVDMDRLMSLRASLNAGRDKPLGLNAFVMRIAAAVLEKHPIINASWEGDALRYLPSADIGLAVALEGGLITPIVRACERKGIAAIDAELTDLVDRARSGKLSPDEYLGASFTISNLGAYGVEEFTAVINPPGSAILALGALVKEPVVKGEQIVVGRTMRITLSCDHRVIDGAVAAAFMADLKAALEEPGKALA